MFWSTSQRPLFLFRSHQRQGLVGFDDRPAALALIVVAALKLGKDVFRPSRELIIAGVAFVLALSLRLNPALILLAGGALGAFTFQKVQAENETKKKGSGK